MYLLVLAERYRTQLSTHIIHSTIKIVVDIIGFSPPTANLACSTLAKWLMTGSLVLQPGSNLVWSLIGTLWIFWSPQTHLRSVWRIPTFLRPPQNSLKSNKHFVFLNDCMDSRYVAQSLLLMSTPLSSPKIDFFMQPFASYNQNRLILAKSLNIPRYGTKSWSLDRPWWFTSWWVQLCATFVSSMVCEIRVGLAIDLGFAESQKL